MVSPILGNATGKKKNKEWGSWEEAIQIRLLKIKSIVTSSNVLMPIVHIIIINYLY